MIGVKFVTFSVDQNSALDTGCFEVVQFFDGLDENAEKLKEIPFEYTSTGNPIFCTKNFNKTWALYFYHVTFMFIVIHNLYSTDPKRKVQLRGLLE